MARVGRITDISNTPWRDDLLPAHFDGLLFHVESGSREGGRRIVVHEFPKRDLPYSEDMGRSAITFTVRGYCITYPFETSVTLYSRDYRKARNLLQQRLDEGGPGTLQLPTMSPLKVVCQRYRMTEEEKFGGYVVFDMQFVELGAPPFRAVENTEEALRAEAQRLKAIIQQTLKKPSPQYRPRLAPRKGTLGPGPGSFPQASE